MSVIQFLAAWTALSLFFGPIIGKTIKGMMS